MTDRELMQQALENCRLLAAKHRNQEWAQHILRFCEEAGVRPTALRERLAKPEQTISMTEYKRLQDLVTSQGIRLMEYESAHPKQEPFCYHDGRNIVGKEFADHSDVFPLYTAPPRREWVGLTEEEKRQLFEREDYDGWIDYINAIEAKLREKNA